MMNSVATQNFFKPGGDSGNHTHEFYDLPNKGLMEEWAPLHPLTTHKTKRRKINMPSQWDWVGIRESDTYRLETSRVKKPKIRFGKSSPRSPHEHPILGIYEDVIQPPTMRRGTFLTVESCLPQSFKDASNESVRFDRTI